METTFSYLVLLMALTPHVCGAQLNTSDEKSKNTKVIMTASENKQIAARLYEDALNNRDFDLLEELISEEYTGAGGLKGADGFKEPVIRLIHAFPDIRWHVEDLVAEGDKVVIRWTWQGTHREQFTNIPATGKIIHNEGMAIFQLKELKIVNTIVQTDRLGFLQALDILPQDITQLSKPKHNPGQVRFIDKFFVPAAAKPEFYERMRTNRNFIKYLPGFIEDAAYEYADENGDLICITIALWENAEAVSKAKAAVQTEYQKQGFDPTEMFKRLKIVMDRGIYTQIVDQ